MAQATVQADNVSKRFGPVTALRDVSLTASAGQTTVLFGANGAGKSTLLNIISGVTASFTGTVTIAGLDVRKRDDSDRAVVGYVGHDSLLYDDLSGRENLRFYSRLYRVRDANQIEVLLARVGMIDHASKPVRSLSRGMKQRVSIARALLHQPKVLLLDEPFSGLDESAIDVLLSLLVEHTADGGTAIVATHQVERGVQMADHVVVLNRGSVAGAFADGVAVSEVRRLYRGEEIR